MPPYQDTEKLPCGTYAAYRRHLYHGESPCLPCRKARAADSRARDRAKRAPGRAPSGLTPYAELAQRITATAGTGSASRFLLDICEAIEGPTGEWYSELRAEQEWDAR